MRNIRAFIDRPLGGEDELILPQGPAHHLLRVLRLRPGTQVRLFDGSGFEYPAEILPAQKRNECRVRLGRAEQPVVESRLNITLIQAIGRGDRMDWCIQKATELGVSRIQPVETERTEVRLDAERAEKRRLHWQQVATAAAEQSGRVWVPPVERSQALGALVEAMTSGDGLDLFLDPLAEHSAASLQRPASDAYALIVGPEGGLSPAETECLLRRGFDALRLGPRVMRTETAGPVAIALLQARFGDLA